VLEREGIQIYIFGTDS